MLLIALIFAAAACQSVLVETGKKVFETKISARLLTEPEVRSVNYRWRAVRNSVYLIGRARSETELERALDICTSVDGVVAVKHFVEVRPLNQRNDS